MAKPSLVIAGTGIRSGGHLTPEARTAIERAGRVFHVLTDPLTEELVLRLNPRAESLRPLYGRGKQRWQTYEEMVQTLLAPLREGVSVAAAFYGHPGVFAFPGHEAVRRARAEGYHARMLPGVSAEDCLFADLNLDPADDGCQSYEATDFLLARRRIDPTAPLVLWQIAYIGVSDYRENEPNLKGLGVLAEALIGEYGAAHEVVVYEAAPLPGVSHSAHRVRLDALVRAKVTPRSTLYVPPLPRRAYDAGLLKLLGMELTASGGAATALANAPATKKVPRRRTAPAPRKQR